MKPLAGIISSCKIARASHLTVGVALLSCMLISSKPSPAYAFRPLPIGIYIRRSATIDPIALQASVAAVQIQLNRDFDQYYLRRGALLVIGRKPAPSMRVFVTDRPLWKFHEWVDGYHWYDEKGPYAVVTTNSIYGPVDLTSILSHEILEMVADPLADGREIVDGLGRFYHINGFQVNDFRLPHQGGDFCSIPSMFEVCY